jgi:hypothetical protein
MIVRFHGVLQHRQGLEPDSDYMQSEVLFDLIDGGRTYTDLRALVKQAAGSSFEGDVLEVGPPVGYEGPFDQQRFAESAEQYFRSLVGSQGSGIHVEGGAVVEMRDNIFRQEQDCEI